MKFSIYLAAFLPWGVLAPLNVLKLMLNAVSPTAHFWVPKETEQCQGACGIARMWAQLFWSLQFISALSFVYVHQNVWQCPSSARASPQGAPFGSGQRSTPEKRPSRWAPSRCLGCSS